ncbi:MAG TPA: hypothetical protein VJV22_07980 [Acidobacteriaceae bacterium]|nr:hypothetical protein [Acidobacteriaceae bacterium]
MDRRPLPPRPAISSGSAASSSAYENLADLGSANATVVGAVVVMVSVPEVAVRLLTL